MWTTVWIVWLNLLWGAEQSTRWLLLHSQWTDRGHHHPVVVASCGYDIYDIHRDEGEKESEWTRNGMEWTVSSASHLPELFRFILLHRVVVSGPIQFVHLLFNEFLSSCWFVSSGWTICRSICQFYCCSCWQHESPLSDAVSSNHHILQFNSVCHHQFECILYWSVKSHPFTDALLPIPQISENWIFQKLRVR